MISPNEVSQRICQLEKYLQNYNPKNFSIFDYYNKEENKMIQPNRNFNAEIE